MSISKAILFTSFVVAAAGTPSTAFAYFPGKIQQDGAELKQQPRSDANTVKTLPAGTAFNASDKPTNGYYYIRTATDIGWISGDAIGKPAGQPAATAQTDQRRTQNNNRQRRTVQRTAPKRSYMVKAWLDYNMFKVSELNNATQSSSFENGTGWGLEFMYFFNPLTAIGLRIDSIGQEVSANNTSNNTTIDFKLTTFAVMVGGERIFWQNKEWYFAGIGYLGFASSSLTETANDGSTNYSGKPITLLGVVEGGYKLTSMFNLYGELGYRILNSSNVTASQTSTNSDIVQGPVSLNFTGPVIGLGLAAHF